jgi:hypothetical protein
LEAVNLVLLDIILVFLEIETDETGDKKTTAADSIQEILNLPNYVINLI